MNLKLVFRIGAVVFLINALGLLVSTGKFLFGMANLAVSPSLLTVGQFMGATFLILALLYWKTPDLAGQGIASFGQLFAIFHGLWVLIIGYHIVSGQASGPLLTAT
jgi:hypothetical protein